jgi:glycosyltransferase involved in cell wall biosynthesis
MRILMVHNHYQLPGGEDESFRAEVELLRQHGEDVKTWTVHNDALKGRSAVRSALETIWNARAAAELRARVQRDGPFDVVHFQNTFPLLSPATIWAAGRSDVAVVQSLRNYRLLCVNGMFFRDGAVCESCLDRRVQVPGVVHACYRGSVAASAVVATMNAYHRARGTQRASVDAYIAPSEFAKRKLAHAGLDIDRIDVKPNVVTPDPGPGHGTGGYAIYVGRLSPEKGVQTMLRAWTLLEDPPRLKVVGDGPQADLVRAASSAQGSRIEWIGHRPKDEVLELIGNAAVLIMPSQVYETFGRVVVESFAKGTPVICSKLGAVAELVEEGYTGARFEPGDPHDLAATVTRFMAQPQARAFRERARAQFERVYAADTNYRILMAIYERAIERKRRT